jgi:hypothetical protein
VSLDEPLDGSKKQGNDLEKKAGVDDYAILELGVTGQVLRRRSDTTILLRDDDDHEISSNQTPPEGDLHPCYVRPILREVTGSAKPFGGPDYTAKQPEVDEKDLYVSGGSECVSSKHFFFDLI